MLRRTGESTPDVMRRYSNALEVRTTLAREACSLTMHTRQEVGS
jgi:hypothetical protein